MKILKIPKRLFRALYSRVFGKPGRHENAYLRKCKTLLHIGANDGYERDLYAGYGLTVLWVEANPLVFEVLVKNLAPYSRQRAFLSLVTDKDGVEHDFHLSNNAGLSSSIYELKDHKKLWPEVKYTGTLRLRSSTLESLVRQAGMQETRFDAIVLDVQGAEQLVIEGAGSVLDNVKYVKLEAADFEAYAGACTLDTITQILAARGFQAEHRTAFKHLDGVGSYYDVLYSRKEAQSI